ncbi:NAD(P)/FAD-dependent oxidoreductase [Streptomyces sp. I05A-00742]|uniref:NAD(P)/FAD-dependent oxidoreductase n=1 Tax=Streptomyces sp. I05A-00742 TaxID=2732853 RepID=UPI0014887518|nr:FAD-dependent oxidoreductase [Streptomyces sp. I05A-00742]
MSGAGARTVTTSGGPEGGDGVCVASVAEATAVPETAEAAVADHALGHAVDSARPAPRAVRGTGPRAPYGLPRRSVRRVAVVGAGMAAARFARQFLALAPPGGAEVTLYGAEPQAPYNRALLTGVLQGRYAPATLALPTGGATVRTGNPVVAVDTAARTLRTVSGTTAGYDTLVLATGAAPVLPDLGGLRTASGAPKAGVHPLRTLADCARIAEDARDARAAVVVGGGVLAVGAAHALAAGGLPVHLVHRAAHLMDRHLDAGAAATVRRTLEASGVTVHRGPAARLLGDDRVTGLELADGRRIDARLAVLACGVRPRAGLARAAGLKVASGVVVDDTLAASAPDVHAIGDCAEHGHVLHGRAEAAWEQADALAAALAEGRRGRACPVPPALVRLGAGPLEVAAFGDSTGTGAGTEAVTLADATRGTYRKLVLRDDVPVGAILVGDLTTVGDVADAVARGEPVAGDALDLLVGGG